MISGSRFPAPGSRPLIPGRRPRRHRRRGYTLVIFALLFFSLLALGAVLVDIGLARMTQRQMKTAADAAALEGLRLRDAVDQQRAEAAKFADLVFDRDGDFDPDSDADSRWQQLEAARAVPGISGDFVDLVQDFAYRPSALSDRPNLEPNSDDDEYGDLAAGSFDGEFHAGTGNSAFQVQLRRTGEASIPGVARIAPRIPFLFARGALLGHAQAGVGSQRGPGIAVRATAVADARPAKSVGASQVVHGMPGAVAFGIYASNWRSLSATLSTNIVIQSDGSMSSGIGHVTQAGGGSEVTVLGDWRPQVGLPGDAAAFVAAVYASVPESRIAYVLILGDVGSPAADRVVGFGWITLNAPPSSGISFTKGRSQIAFANGSAALIRPIDGAVTPSEVEAVMEQHQWISRPEVEDDAATPENESDPTISSLLAPALVR